MSEIADYRFIEELGSGDHGRCFLAATPTRLGLDDDRVVVKLLARKATASEFRRVVDELRVYAAVDRESLVPVYDVGYSEGALYYAMAFCEGGSLAAPAAPPGTAQTLRAVADAARGAHALHEVGMVHRNIKPSNVLIDRGAGRLSDLGLAHVLAPGMTSTGVGVVDTAEFIDPTVLAGHGASRLSDIWSLGLTLHRAVTGVSVYRGLPDDDPMEALRQVLRERPDASDDLDDGLREIVVRCTSADAGRRFVTAAELAEALDAVPVAE